MVKGVLVGESILQDVSQQETLEESLQVAFAEVVLLAIVLKCI